MSKQLKSKIAKLILHLQANLNTGWTCPENAITIEGDHTTKDELEAVVEWLNNSGIPIPLSWSRKGLEKATKAASAALAQLGGQKVSASMDESPIEDDGWLVAITSRQQETLGKRGANCMGRNFVTRRGAPAICLEKDGLWWGFGPWDEVKGHANEHVTPSPEEWETAKAVADRWWPKVLEASEEEVSEAQQYLVPLISGLRAFLAQGRHGQARVGRGDYRWERRYTLEYWHKLDRADARWAHRVIQEALAAEGAVVTHEEFWERGPGWTSYLTVEFPAITREDAMAALTHLEPPGTYQMRTPVEIYD